MRPAVRVPALARAVALALIVSAVGAAPAAAYDATPAAFPSTPDPSECRVAPRPPDEVLSLLAASPIAAAPVAGPATPATAEADLPAGPPADAATAGALAATVRELVACNNAGELARVFAFYSDGVLRGALAGDPAAALALAVAAPPTGGSQAELVDVRGVRLLDDGSAGAVVVVRDAQKTVVVFLVFVRSGDRWLIDERIDVRADGTPTP